MKLISSRLGHSKPNVTMNVYGHLIDGIDEQAADALDAVFQQAAVPYSCHPDTGDVVELPGA